MRLIYVILKSKSYYAFNKVQQRTRQTVTFCAVELHKNRQFNSPLLPALERQV